MNVTLSSVLLFCLFSFLFGAFSAVFLQLLYAVMAALRLLPSVRPRREADNEKNALTRTKKRYVIGYFFFDSLSILLLSVFYLIFLYAANEGVFRLHSLLLAICGGILLFRPLRFAAYPLFFLLDLGVSFFAFLFSAPVTFVRFLFKKREKKTRGVLDETEKMV